MNKKCTTMSELIILFIAKHNKYYVFIERRTLDVAVEFALLSRQDFYK